MKEAGLVYQRTKDDMDRRELPKLRFWTEQAVNLRLKRVLDHPTPPELTQTKMPS